MKRIVCLAIVFVMSVWGFTQEFKRLPGEDIKGGYLGFASWCDYNSDGLLDIFVTGVDFDVDFKHAEIYRNNGDKTFTQVNITNIPRVIYGDLDWCDYDKNGTLDLIYAGTRSGFNEKNITKIYKNINNSEFVEISHAIPRLQECSVDWVDVDNDGNMDVYYQGITSESEFDLGIYRNGGNDQFIPVDINIEPIKGNRGNFSRNSSKWVDFDNDGLTDVLIAMASQDEFRFEFYKNKGNFQFQKVEIGLPQLNYVSLAIGDFNQDGLMDFVCSGSSRDYLSSSDSYADAYVFINKGALEFDRSNRLSNVGVFINTIETGDFNNDGYLDIMYYGDNRIQLYQNNQDETFSYVAHTIVNSIHGGARFGDFDNDHDLDILYYGRFKESDEIEATYVYENKSSVVNAIPRAPEQLFLEAVNNDVIFSWGPGDDDLTAKGGLYYNLIAGTSGNPNSLMAGNALNGYLKKPFFGNRMNQRTFRYKNLLPGSYQFKVQAIDNSFNGSDFSDAFSFCFTSSEGVLGDTITLCEGDSVLLDVEGDFTAYRWNTGENSSAIYAKKAGLYNLNLTDREGCLRSETVYIKENSIPALNLGADIDGCVGDTIVLSAPEFEKVLWSTDSTCQTIHVAQSNTYWVQVFDRNACSNSDTLKVMFHAGPQFSLGSDTTLFRRDTLELSTPGGDDAYLWSTGDMGDRLVIYAKDQLTGDHTYWLKATNHYGCIATDSVKVTVSEVARDEQSPKFRDRDLLKVYPVPFENELILWGPNPISGITRIKLLDVKGQVLLQTEMIHIAGKQTLPLSMVASGVYFLHVQNALNSYNKVFKVIKK